MLKDDREIVIQSFINVYRIIEFHSDQRNSVVGDGVDNMYSGTGFAQGEALSLLVLLLLVL